MSARWIMVGAASAFVAVAMGAFGAHALRESLSERALAIYHTGAQYQMYHALALVALGAWLATQPAAPPGANLAGWLFTAGTVVFSGSLYALALTDIKVLGAITPIGGLAFLAGWLSLGWAAWRGVGGPAP